MNVDKLREKVVAAEEKIEKCKKTIERHKAQMEKKAEALRKMGIEPDNADKYALANNGTNAGRDAYWLLCDYDSKKDDIKGAISKLVDAERIAAGWKEKLDIEINKEKVIQDTVPLVIKDFLEKWKADAFDWYVQRYDAFLVFRKDLREQEIAARLEALNTLPELEKAREMCAKVFGEDGPDNSYLANLWPRTPVEKFLKERRLDYSSIREKLKNFGDQIIFKMLDYSNADERLTWLDKTLEEEKKHKLIALVDSITHVTGPITDAKHLYVSAGDLNGVVVGEKGVAKIQTYSAGGHSVQCFHWRTRVDDVTDKYIENPSFNIYNARVCTYQFPRFEGGDDMVAKDYGLEVVSCTKDDTTVKGQYRDILAFADNYLGYQLVPEYLKDVVAKKPSLDEVLVKCAAEVKKTPSNKKEKDIERME